MINAKVIAYRMYAYYPYRCFETQFTYDGKIYYLNFSTPTKLDDEEIDEEVLNYQFSDECINPDNPNLMEDAYDQGMWSYIHSLDNVTDDDIDSGHCLPTEVEEVIYRAAIEIWNKNPNFVDEDDWHYVSLPNEVLKTILPTSQMLLIDNGNEILANTVFNDGEDFSIVEVDERVIQLMNSYYNYIREIDKKKYAEVDMYTCQILTMVQNDTNIENISTFARLADDLGITLLIAIGEIEHAGEVDTIFYDKIHNKFYTIVYDFIPFDENVGEVDIDNFYLKLFK